MVRIPIPYGRKHLEAKVPTANFIGSYTAVLSGEPNFEKQKELVRNAMRSPIGSPRLEQLVRDKRSLVIIASDHTRPVPSKVIMPLMLEEARCGNPDVDITILIATGFHRATTHEELITKFGKEIVAREKIVVHNSTDAASLIKLNNLPSGGELWLNHLAIEADVLAAEGFIEPHFFAGFSGGRKSVLPGVAGRTTVLANHCAEFINSTCAKTGILENNPIHRDMLFAAEQARLAYIVNVVIDANKNIVKAFAGHREHAHHAGCSFLTEKTRVKVPDADIVITSNGGHPLDQNVYQAVKGMTAAAAAVRPSGAIIMVAACNDGHGGQDFYEHLANANSPAELLQQINKIPRNATMPDQWEFQILAKILCHCSIIMVTEQCNAAMIRAMHMQYASNIDDALELALNIKGKDASVAVIPDGVAVIVERAPTWVCLN